MTEDDNGEVLRVLKTVSSYPYFSFFIQDMQQSHSTEPVSEEEESIKQTYDYFVNQLSENNLRKIFLKVNINSNSISYINLLKAIRDQVLLASVIEFYTSNISLANKLFENLNAKGKQLAYIDLIKNKLFEKLDSIEPADFAKETWTNIIKQLSSGKERTGIATFLRHYWASKYKRSTSKTIYDDFKKQVKTSEYEIFMNDLKKEAIIYRKITNPSRDDYDNRKEHFWLVQSLNIMGNYFNVVQVRVPLLALYYVKNKGIISLSKFKEVVFYLENFHFVYNAILSKSPNRIDPIYSKFSIAVRKSINKTEANQIIDNLLYDPIKHLFPNYEEFEKGFIGLYYTKKDNPANLRTKYVINKLNSYYSSKEIFDDEGSIEHILPEKNGKSLINIGNLILLERNLNQEAGNKTYEEKKVIYKKSKYKWVNEFCNIKSTFTENDILSRAKEMAQDYYTKILKLNIV